MLLLLITLFLLHETQSACPAGFFLNISTSSCDPCYPSCQTCTGPTSNDCMTCILGITLNITSCLCPSNQYFNQTALSCDSCHSSCLTCQGNLANQCLTCDLPSKLYGGECINCPYNSYINSTGDCAACHDSCFDCSGPSINECTSCRNNMVLSNQSCICPQGTFLHKNTYTCLSCHPSCQSCTGPLQTQCLSCPAGLTQKQNTCSCPSSYYFDTVSRSCLPCDQSCAGCSGPSAAQCLSCADGKFLKNNTCKSCDSSCQTCSGPAINDCIKCSSTEVLLDGQCIPKKNNGCDSSCNQCQGPSSDECVVCNQGLFFMQGGKSGYCVSSCPQSYYQTSDISFPRCLPKLALKGTLSVAKDINTYKLYFGTDISAYYNTIVSIMEIQILLQPKQKPLSFTNTTRLLPNNKGMLIYLDFNAHLIPKNVLLVKFNDFPDQNFPVQIIDTSLQIELQESMEYSNTMQNAITAASALNSASQQGNDAFSLSSSFILKSIHSIRSQVMETMMSYLMLMNVDFPPNLIQYATELNANADQFLPDFFSSTADRIDEEKAQRKTNTISSRRILSQMAQAKENNYNGIMQSELFVSNYGAELSVLLLAIMISIAVEIVIFFIPKKYEHKRIFSVIKYVSRSLRYNFILNEWISNYHDLALFSMMDSVNITDFRAADAWVYLAGPLALIAAVLTPFVFYFLIRWFNRKLEEYNAANNKEQHKYHDLCLRLRMIVEPFKPTDLSYLMYNLLLMARSFGFALIIVFACELPTLQVMFIPLVTISVIFYLIKWKPFKLTNQLYITITYEILFLLASIFVLVLHFVSQNSIEEATIRTNLGFAIIGCGLVMMGLDFLSMVIDGIEMYRLWRKRRAQKVAPLALAAVPQHTASAKPACLPNQSTSASNFSSSIKALKLPLEENETPSDNSIINEKVDTKSPSISGITPKKNFNFYNYGASSRRVSANLKSKRSVVWPTRDLLIPNPLSPSDSEKETIQFSVRTEAEKRMLSKEECESAKRNEKDIN